MIRSQFVQRMRLGVAAAGGAVLFLVAPACAGTGAPATTATASGAAASATAGNPDFRVERVSGKDRYEGAVAVSRRFFGSGAGTVVIASGENYPDGLAAGPAADQLGGPVLFVKRDHVPSATAAEVQRLRPSRVFVLGGENTVNAATYATLDALTSASITRIGGSDRFSTAALVSRAAFAGGARTAYVASGLVWPDALAGGAAAAVQDAPMLLTDDDTVPAALRDELTRLHPDRIMLLGGPDAVSSSVANSLNGIATVERVYGSNRYATALAVSARVFGPDRHGVVVTTGAAYPDALAGVPATKSTHGPILLAQPTKLASGTESELTRLGPDTAYVLGGPAALTIDVPRYIQRTLGICWAGLPTTSTSQAVIDSVPGTGGLKIAYTLDMGGRLEGAADIVRYLTDHQVCTTFFPTSIMASTDDGRSVMRLIANHPELFEVGNHTVHHCDLVLGGGGSPTTAPCNRPMTSDFIRSELTGAESVLKDLSGMPIRPYWRPPFGSHNSTVRDIVAGVGYPKTIMWSRDTIDWSEATTTQQIIDRVLDPPPANGTIVLSHLGGYHTGEALPTIADALRDRGYTMTTLSDLLDG